MSIRIRSREGMIRSRDTKQRGMPSLLRIDMPSLLRIDMSTLLRADVFCSLCAATRYVQMTRLHCTMTRLMRMFHTELLRKCVHVGSDCHVWNGRASDMHERHFERHAHFSAHRMIVCQVGAMGFAKACSSAHATMWRV